MKDKLRTTYKSLITIAGYQPYTLFDGGVAFDAEKLFSDKDEDKATIVPIETQKISIPVNVFLLIGHGKKY